MKTFNEFNKVKTTGQFLNENVKIADGYNNRQYSETFEEQFNKGEIWFEDSETKQLYCIKKNKGFIGEVKAMWTLFYKMSYFEPIRDKKNNLLICNDGFKNVSELFNWLNPILIDHHKNYNWNVFAK